MGDKKDKEAQLPWIIYSNYSRHGRLAYLFTLQLLTREFDLGYSLYVQRAKKVVSDSPGLVDFAIGLMNSVFNLPDGQVMFYEEFE